MALHNIRITHQVLACTIYACVVCCFLPDLSGRPVCFALSGYVFSVLLRKYEKLTKEWVKHEMKCAPHRSLFYVRQPKKGHDIRVIVLAE